MDAIDFQNYWNSYYPLCPPVAHLIREAYQERWFRICTLPEAKRYPETEEEYQEIFRRHNSLLCNLFPDNRVTFLVTVGYSETAQPVMPEHIDPSIFPSTLSMSLAMHQIEVDDAGDSRYWHLWVCVLEWRSGRLDDLFRLIADDRVANVLIVDPEQHQLYHPYDGGADVIIASQTAREHLRLKYSQWLATHPAGL
ncbi:MAG TPA: hypothetical protein VMP08_08430 [Anaerolineae bacterium]|nr:hypothetical protein [Anaerolineae bacterium]